MTREQAINYLFSSGFTNEQVGEVVRALTYEPTPKNDLGVDCIDRKAIEKHIEDGLNSGKYGHDAVNIMTEIHFMPSVTPQPCEDAVSRQEVLYLIADYDLSMGQVVRGIHALPPVTPKERKGHWIECMPGGAEEWCYKCSECNFWKYKKTINLSKFKFCPNCGADMREVEE